MKQLKLPGRVKRVLLAMGIAITSTSGYSFAGVVESINHDNDAIFSEQQEQKITGTVTDDSGIGLPGVSISIKGTTTGTVTDVYGKYQISASPTGVLVFSFVGMKTQEVNINDQKIINVTLENDAIGLDEIVAVGYGYQKKANLTGATTIVKSEELVKRPVSNSASMLQGRVAGLNIVQNSGQPGDEGIRIRLRGISSFKNSTPYVLIDGIEGDLSALNPSDIENITVLKDAASAAIYGSRAANGVVLVTTKSGVKGETKVEASVNFGLQKATILPDFIYNSVEHMELWNKGAAHTGVSQVYPQEMIDAYRNAEPGDPRYPNFNWMDHMFKTAKRQEYQLAISGGSEKNTYYINMGFMDQEGIMEGYGAKKYSARFKMDLELNKSINFGFNTGFVYRDEEEPTNESIYEQMLYAYTMPPTMSPYLSDGSGRHSARDIPEIWRNRNPQAVADNPGYTHYDKYEISPQAYIDIHPFKGFSWKTTAAWRYDRTEKEHMYEEMTGYVFSTNEFFGTYEPFQEGVYHNDWRSSNIHFNSIINYNKAIEDQNFSLVAGYEQQEMNYDNIYAYRPNYSSIKTTDIDAGTPEDQELSGNTSSWSLQSLFGRLSYDYKGKYLVEGNLRYDGTSKMAKKHRWDLFPSMSLGWRLSEEDFMEDLSWLDNLKLRVSAGQLGNQAVLSDYPYQELYANSLYPVNGSLQSGISANALSNPDLVWEVVTTYNLGVDLSVKNGLFGLELDVYKKETEGGHDRAQIPASVGKTPPLVNYKNMENTGFEITLRHSNRIGEFKYDVSFMADHYKNKITKIEDNNWGSTFYGRSNVEGHAINEYYMLDWIGIYQNQDEIDNLPIYEPFRSQTQPGDLIFRDVNEDGEITIEGGKGDRVFIKGYHPKLNYSFNLNMEYKNFDLSMFWQGVAGKKNLARWIGYEPFMQGGPVTKKWRNAWDGEGSTNSMPALYNIGQIYRYNPITERVSDFHLHDASYLRLKNIQLGYNLPQTICSKIGVHNCRIYVSGDNLITFTDFEYDPERSNDNFTTNTFPQLKTYSIGAKLTF
ncbi:SusC/RagA family TonB-linked outer membrane protein [Marinifilum sp.]|uniref:SusC/RagA family TonB-linked outer membrane protein n=1 Tax=Marinifilum sp. TaxID=2033137 RepID=UPI003BACF4DA